MTAPALRFVAHLEVEVGEPIDVGDVAGGRRRIVPITGGTVTGDLLSGRIRPGGADYQLVHGGTVTRLEARYVLETDRDELVFVTNRAVRSGTLDDLARIARGEPVDPARIYFRGTPVFETAAARLAMLTERIFVVTGERRPDLVVLDVFEVG